MHAFSSLFLKHAPVTLVGLGVVVGVGGAVGAALFHTLIALTTTLFYGPGDQGFIATLSDMPWWQRVLIPTLGGLLVGIIYTLTKVTEAEGEGVPEVMEALAEKKGVIRPLVAPVKIITAVLTLGSGGSAGREGPVIQIGSAIGSSIGQFAKLAPAERSLMLAAGAAAAIGGTFGAPIAGVLFTIEILRHRSFGFIRACVIVSAAFIGAAGTRVLTDHEGLRFPVPTIPDISPTLIVTLFILGIIAALVALGFGVMLRLGKYLFQKTAIPHLLRPALGGLMIGLLGLLIPYIHEPAAYPLMIDLMAFADFSLAFLALLLLVKMVATGITLGSGGSGGIFAPLLLLGAILGSVVASIVVLTTGASPLITPVLIVLGMAAVFAGAAHAPLTAAFITYEMTGEILLLIPLLVICYIATWVAKAIKHDSVYRL